MDNVEVDNLLGDFGSGDTTPAVVPNPSQVVPPLKREQDSTDDFEHLERDSKQDTGELPVHSQSAARAATQGFLDMERAPSAADQLADKFTDSESDNDPAGESPLHRPAPPAPIAAPVVNLPPTPAPTPVVKTAPEPQPAFEAFVTSPPELPKPEPPAQPKVEVKAPPSAPIEPPKPQAQPPKPQAPPPTRSEPKPEPPQTKPVAHVIEAEVIFCQMGLDAWFDPKRLHPQVESLMYWRDPARSGAALGGGLALLVALACCSVVSVGSYAALLALAAALGFRLYKNVLQAVHKTNDGHPFKSLLEHDISVSAERSQQLAAAATAHLNAASQELRRLFLVEDLVDSLKFGVLLWCLTYVGACFNGITLIILAWIALFTLPKAYEMNKAQVDSNLELARAKINEITAKVRAAVPLGRKSESEKDK